VCVCGCGCGCGCGLGVGVCWDACGGVMEGYYICLIGPLVYQMLGLYIRT
jgi:hypothetical protein